MKAYPKCVIPTPPDGVVDWGASLISLLQPLGTSLRTKRRWVTTPLQTPGGCLPACQAPAPL